MPDDLDQYSDEQLQATVAHREQQQVQQAAALPLPKRADLDSMSDEDLQRSLITHQVRHQAIIQPAKEFVAKNLPAEEPTEVYLGRTMGIGFNAIMNHQYGAAMQRLEAEQHTDADLQTIAEYQHHQEQVARGAPTSTAGQLGETALGLPSMALQFAAGGIATKGVALGLRGLGILGAEAAPAATLAGRIGQGALEAAASTPAVPALYMERWQHNNIEAGRHPEDLRGLPNAMAIGAAQNAVLGAFGAGVHNLGGETLAGAAKRIAAQAGGGIFAQSAADIVTSAVGLDTGYGLAGDLYDGRYGDAAKHAMTTAFTFAAFAGQHEVTRAFADGMKELHQQGRGAQDAATIMQEAADKILGAVKDNPDLTKAEAGKVVGKVDPAAQAYADALKTSLERNVTKGGGGFQGPILTPEEREALTNPPKPPPAAPRPTISPSRGNLAGQPAAAPQAKPEAQAGTPAPAAKVAPEPPPPARPSVPAALADLTKGMSTDDVRALAASIGIQVGKKATREAMIDALGPKFGGRQLTAAERRINESALSGEGPPEGQSLAQQEADKVFKQRFPVGETVEFTHPGSIARKGSGEVVDHVIDPVTGDTFAKVKLPGGGVEMVGDANDIARPAKPASKWTTYEDFAKEYWATWKQFQKYGPDQIGGNEAIAKMAKMSDAHPEWADRAEQEQPAPAAPQQPAAPPPPPPPPAPPSVGERLAALETALRRELDQTGKLSPERQQFYQNESRKLMEEDAASRPAATDPITGYGLERERSKAVMEAVRQQGETGQPATYVDMDITNHEALRRSGGANEHVKGMMQVIETELRKLSPDAEVFRHSGPNGDEFSAVVPGVDEAAVQKAIATAREKLGGYAKKNGLADLAHTKEGRGAGVGVEFGTAALKAGTDPRQSVAEAERQTSVAREGQLQPGQKMPVDELRRRLEGGEDIPGLTKAHAADLKALILEGKTLEDAGEERGVRRQAVNQSIERALEKLHGLIEEPEAPTVGAGGQRESVLDLPNQWRENPTHEKIDDILNNWVGEESRAGRQLSEQESAAVIKWKKRLAGPPGKGRRRAIKEATDFLDAKAAERAAGEPAPVQAAGGEPVPAEPAEPPAPAGGQGRAARSAAGEAEAAGNVVERHDAAKAIIDKNVEKADRPALEKIAKGSISREELQAQGRQAMGKSSDLFDYGYSILHWINTADPKDIVVEYNPRMSDLPRMAVKSRAAQDAIHKALGAPVPESKPPSASRGKGVYQEVRGAPTKIVTPDGKEIDARYELRDIVNVRASHHVMRNGSLRDRVAADEYPEGLQPRAYNSPGEQQKVDRIAGHMQPAMLVNKHPAASEGPPTITRDGNIVLNGNGRQMGLERSLHLDTYDQYKQELIAQAQTYGIDPAAVKAMQRPGLYRVVDMDPRSPEAKAFAAAGNVSMTQAQSPTRAAASLSRLVTPEVIDSLKLEGDTTFSEAVTDPKLGKAFRQRLRDELPPQEAARFFHDDGRLTDAGTELVRNMLLSKILPTDLIERMGKEMAGMKRTIEAALPNIIQGKRDFPAADISPQLVEAIGVLIRNPEQRTMADMERNVLEAKGFFGAIEPLSPGGRMMLDFLWNNGNQSKVFRQKLGALMEDLQGTKGLFGEEYPDVVSMAAQHLGVKPREGAAFGDVAGADEEVQREQSKAIKDRGFGPKRVEEVARSSEEEGVAQERARAGEPPSESTGDEPTGGAPSGGEFGAKSVDPPDVGDLPGGLTSVGGIPGNPGSYGPPDGAGGGGGRPERLTALAKEVEARERIARGLGEIVDGFKRNYTDAWDKAIQDMRADPAAGERLVESLLAKPRPTSLEENADLLVRKVALSHELDKAMFNPQAPGDLMDATSRFRAASEVLDKLDRLDKAIHSTGSEAGAAFNFRKQLAALDYSLAGMLQRARAAKGERLTPEEVAKVEDLQRQNAELKAKLAAAEDRYRNAPKGTADAGDVRRLQQNIDLANQEIVELQKKLREAGPGAGAGAGPGGGADAARLEELEKQVNGLKKKLVETEQAAGRAGFGSKAYGDLTDARIASKKADKLFDNVLFDFKAARKPPGDRIADWLIKLRINEVISSPLTLAKIVAAGFSRLATTPMEEAAGAAWELIPGIAKIAAMAPRQGGGLNIAAEKAAFSAFFTKGFSEMLRTVKTGQSDIDVLHGKPAAARGWLDLQFGLHDAAKANAVTAEWTRSVIKIIDSEARAGRDVTSPAALLRIEGMAYREAQAAKFRQENWAVTAYNRAVGSMRASDNPIANATGIAAKLLLPVVRVPTNLAFEVAQHAFGLGTGSILATRAWMKGVENLKPHEAEAVMRNLKKGSIGAAALLVGYLNPTVFGGYYSGKRDDKDVQAGGMRLFGKEVPSWLLHNPLMEALQMGATVRRASEKLYHQTPQGDAVGIGQGLAGWVEEIPFAREPVELAKAISPDPQERGRFFGSMARSFAVPQLVQWLAGQMDKNPRTGQPVKRKPQGVIQNVQMGLPGLRQQVPAAP